MKLKIRCLRKELKHDTKVVVEFVVLEGDKDQDRPPLGNMEFLLTPEMASEVLVGSVADLTIVNPRCQSVEEKQEEGK